MSITGKYLNKKFMTRKEILQFGKEIADKFFHKKHREEVTVKGFVARDRDGKLFLYEGKPIRYNNKWVGGALFHPIDLLPQVKWEDKEPTPVEITIKLE